jgi:hydroxyacylglutathione hydrolase
MRKKKSGMKQFRCRILLAGILITGSTCLEAQWFRISQVADRVWLIEDHQAANIYLVEGNDAALIIDTGLGAADLVSAVRKLTDKPLFVVNTHGHPDHCGANYQFEEIYIHAADSSSAHSLMDPESRERTASMMLQGATPSPEETYTGEIYDPRIITVSEGYVFNLGSRYIQVMETPGHTPGGICLLDKENRMLFSGDNNNSLVWLFLQGCTPLSEYLVTLEKQEKRLGEFDTLFPGHGPKMQAGFIRDQIACVKSILDGTCDPKSYESFAGNALICTFGRASVAFNPDNL